jgi:hypothetical protein
VCRMRLDGRVLMGTLFFLSLLCFIVSAVSCSSESSNEPSSKANPQEPAALKSEPRAEAPAKEGVSSSTVPTGTASIGGGAGQGTAGPGEVTPLDIKAIDFVPARPIAGEPVKVQVNFEKPEAAVVPLHYRWQVNDETVQGADRDLLGYQTKRGDRIEVLIFVGNLREENRARRARVVVDNAPPVVKKVEEHLGTNGEYIARLEASDPDGDMVGLKLQKGPPGMVLDPASKELRWPVPEGTNGSFPVEVLASDPVGASMVLNYSVTIRQQQQSVGSAANATSVSSPSK